MGFRRCKVCYGLRRSQRLNCCLVIAGLTLLLLVIHTWKQGTTLVTARIRTAGSTHSEEIIVRENQLSSLYTSPSNNESIPPTYLSDPTTADPTTANHPILLDKGGIKIMPPHAVVAEGHSLQITCAATQLIHHRDRQSAPHMTFELPPMTSVYKQRVQINQRPGAAVLRISAAGRGHDGVYRCIAKDSTGRMTYNTATITVIQRELSSNTRGMKGRGGLEDMHKPQHTKVINGKKMKGLAISHVNHSRGVQDKLMGKFNMSEMMARGKRQQEEVQRFCMEYNLTHLTYTLPTTNDSVTSLYRHLLINDRTKTLFCFVPKVGCTNLRILFFLVQGYIPMSQFLLSRDAVDQNRLEGAQFTESFYNRNDHQRRHSFNHYFKYMMYRNPLNRLISGFRSKVARYPLVGLYDDKPHFNWLRKAVLMQRQSARYSKFLQNRGKESINITFPDFIDYWLDQPIEIKFDEHFRSILSICQPCRTRYSFYANFNNFDMDSRVLVEKIRAKPEYIRDGYYKNDKHSSTEMLAIKLYSELSVRQKLGVLDIAAQDLDLYYRLFPEEKNSHKNILGLDVELPTHPLHSDLY